MLYPVKKTTIPGIFRDAVAVGVVASFMFPIVWWALTSIKPLSALYDKGRIVFFDFTPTWSNYAVILFGEGPGFFDSRQTIFDTLVVALGSSALTLVLALPTGFALSTLVFKRRHTYLLWIVFQRVLPPIALIIPLVFIYRSNGLMDTYAGVIIAHATVNLPFAVLLLKSFFDDVPREVGEAAMIDGANRFQIFARIFAPMIKGGIAATAVLCFIFSWTEFMMALFLTNTIRLIPVQASIVSTMTWGFTSALSTAALVPSIIFILLVQKHLVRGLTMGLQKG